MVGPLGCGDSGWATLAANGAELVTTTGRAWTEGTIYVVGVGGTIDGTVDDTLVVTVLALIASV